MRVIGAGAPSLCAIVAPSGGTSQNPGAEVDEPTSFPGPRQLGTMVEQRGARAAMRPNKRINPGAHHSGTADSTSKGRHFTTGLPTSPPEPTDVSPAAPAPPRVDLQRESKYVGRASVGPRANDGDLAAREMAHAEWVDPLDQDDYDLTQITIDLRPTMIDEPPETYYQRFSSRIPGHE